VIRGLKRANEIGAATIALLGNQGGKCKDHARLALVVPSSDTARIQEVHITIGHIICELIEEDL
jgi:D-sedoheptulose 7-phosphate isomerase